MPAPALFALEGRPGGVPRSASQHSTEHVGGRSQRPDFSFRLGIRILQSRKSFQHFGEWKITF